MSGMNERVTPAYSSSLKGFYSFGWFGSFLDRIEGVHLLADEGLYVAVKPIFLLIGSRGVPTSCHEGFSGLSGPLGLLI